MNEEDFKTFSFITLQVENPKEPGSRYTHDAAIFFDMAIEKYKLNCFTCGWIWVGKTFDQGMYQQHQRDYAIQKLKGEKND